MYNSTNDFRIYIEAEKLLMDILKVDVGYECEPKIIPLSPDIDRKNIDVISMPQYYTPIKAEAIDLLIKDRIEEYKEISKKR